MATFTASQLGNPSAVHTGVMWNGGVVTISDTAAANSVIKLCQVPNGATIVDWVLWMDDDVGTNTTFQLGTSECASGIASTTSLSTVTEHRPAGGHNLLPVRVSMSDDQALPQTVWVEFKCVTAITFSASNAIIRFGVMYTMDNNITPHATVR